METLDASALRCPLPLLELKLWLKQAESGKRLRLVLADSGSRQDIPAYLERIGQGVEMVKEDVHRLELIVTKHP